MKLARRSIRKRMSLTPMIDVVFLLLTFYMLAARFGGEGAISLAATGAVVDGSGSPRLVEVYPTEVTLNGVPQQLDRLVAALVEVQSSASRPVIIRARDGSDVQRLIDIAEALKGAGLRDLALIE